MVDPTRMMMAGESDVDCQKFNKKHSKFNAACSRTSISRASKSRKVENWNFCPNSGDFWGAPTSRSRRPRTPLPSHGRRAPPPQRCLFAHINLARVDFVEKSKIGRKLEFSWNFRGFSGIFGDFRGFFSMIPGIFLDDLS